MAVNDNDRVTSRRLKQFWDIAKQWIQTLVSGAIDTSEAAMESSMDTKIQAAKPDYNMPNENDQIGVGYGYNQTENDIITRSGSLTFSDIPDLFNYGNGTLNRLYAKQLKYLLNYLGSPTTVAAAERYATHVFKALEGKMIAWPSIMSTNAAYLPDVFKANGNNFKSVYNENENCLVSPIWTVGDTTYQTKLFKRAGNNTTLDFSLSINGGDFVLQTENSWNGDGIGLCGSLNKLPIDLGCCDVLDGYINTAKLANNAVTNAKIANGAVDAAKISSGAVSKDKLSQRVQTNISGMGHKGLNNNYTEVFYNRIAGTANNQPNTALSGLNFNWVYDEAISNNAVIHDSTNHTFTLTKNYYLKIPSDSKWMENYFTGYDWFGFCFIITDVGKYWCPMLISCDTDNNLKIICTLLDATIDAHLTENNAILRLFVPGKNIAGDVITN